MKRSSSIVAHILFQAINNQLGHQGQPRAEPIVSQEIVLKEEPFPMSVKISNSADHLALDGNFRMRYKGTGKEIIPVHYEDDYFPSAVLPPVSCSEPLKLNNTLLWKKIF